MEIVTSSAIREWCWFVAGWSDSTALGAVSVPVGRGREESSGGGDDAVACVNENIEERTRNERGRLYRMDELKAMVCCSELCLSRWHDTAVFKTI